MGSSGAFEEEDRLGASNFAQAAREAGVRRIIYLGGLGSGAALSPHLASRQEVGRILRESGVPTVEFRASIIIGSGSLSFEMIRALVDRLPLMITPRWVRILAQPIAIEDVISYLVAALDVELDESVVVEVGGADRTTYQEIMLEYARQRGLRRLMIPVPVLTPRLSSLWLGLVTPVYSRIGRKLIDSITHETTVRSDLALRLFDIRPRGISEAIERALRDEDEEMTETRWSDALSSRGSVPAWGGVRFGSRLVDSRSARVSYPAAEAFRPIRRIGGKTGWYYANWLWRLARVPGSAGGRRGFAARSPRPGVAAGRRHRRLLAGGGVRAGACAAAVCGDEVAGAGLASIRGRRRRAWLAHPADVHLRPGWPAGPALLVRSLPPALVGVRRHAPRHRQGCRAGGRPAIRWRAMRAERRCDMRVL